MKTRLGIVIALAALLPAIGAAQINFTKTGSYVAMGDSVAAGEGALPVTTGYVYELYDRGVFGRKQQMDFSSTALRGARSWELRDHQVAQLLCAEPALRPSVVTITAGANDFFRGDFNIPAIAARVADAVSLLFHNDSGQVPLPVLDPITFTPCRALSNVTVLVSNYYSIPHPDPGVAAQLDMALRGFDQALRFWLSQIDVPAGSRLAVVDLHSPSLGRQGLVTIQRRLGVSGFDFDVHPTNLGHAFIADAFERAWNALQ